MQRTKSDTESHGYLIVRCQLVRSIEPHVAGAAEVGRPDAMRRSLVTIQVATAGVVLAARQAVGSPDLAPDASQVPLNQEKGQTKGISEMARNINALSAHGSGFG
jgi:hypothetical protein